MVGLDPREQRCLERFCELLRDRLGERLVEIRLFGSAARGDMWPSHSPLHSDIDLLVVTRERVAEREAEDLLNATYPLFLECGRQLSPQFFTEERMRQPSDERTRRFLGDIEADSVRLYPGPTSGPAQQAAPTTT